MQPIPQSGIQEFDIWITQEKWETLEANKTRCDSGGLDPSKPVVKLEKYTKAEN